MTRQCREVLDACDFPPSASRDVERFVARCTPAQVIALVWKKDPEGRHEASWFAPFFDRGYVKSKVSIQCSFGEQFWEAYNEMSSSVQEDFSTFDLPLIDEMSGDIGRMKRALAASRVKSVPYVHKVYLGTEPSRPKDAGNTDAVRAFEVGRGSVRVREGK